MTPEKLVENIAKQLMAFDTGVVNGWDVSDGWEQDMFKRRANDVLHIVLKAIKDGEVVGIRCSECGKDYQLKPSFKAFMEAK